MNKYLISICVLFITIFIGGCAQTTNKYENIEFIDGHSDRGMKIDELEHKERIRKYLEKEKMRY